MFYAWLSLAYASMLGIGLWANRACWRMLALTVTLGADVFLPIPPASTAKLWYFECVLVELLVILIACLLRARASTPIILFSACLILMHLIGVMVGPQAGFGPYRAVVPLLEGTQLLTCILLSLPVLDFLSKTFHKNTESL